MTESLIDIRPAAKAHGSQPEGLRRLRILVLSAVFPSSVEPTRGVFVKERVKAMAALPGCEVRVIAPVPWFPPIKRLSRWYQWSQYPREETVDGLTVYRPRYILPPRIGGYFHPRLMYPAAKRAADRLRDEFPFDVIDAHFVYPAGVVAAMLGRRYGVPVVMTGRGEDMLRFPDMPFKGRRIRWALSRAAHCVALSTEIAEAMHRNGASSEGIAVIPNGVDTTKFHSLPQEDCRRQLGLAADAKIILSVGDRLELKGFHLLVDAMSAVLKSHPGALLAIVGGPGRFGRDYTAAIEERIREHNLHDHVLLAGPKPHDELPLWYNAADLFALMSSREGSPNVLLEALACGTPAVGTPISGIADELANPLMGRLLPERTATAAAEAISEMLSHSANREAIHSAMKTRSWSGTAQRLTEGVFHFL